MVLLKKERINADISKSRMDLTLLKIKQLNDDKDKAYERLARYEKNATLCSRIIKEIESLDEKLNSFYNAW